METTTPEISIVVPVFNEEEQFEELFSRLASTLDGMGRSFEVVAVDDGSTDRSVDVMLAVRQKDERLRIVRLVRNFGQSPALYAGFSNVRGAIVAMMDADLQNPPEELPKLIAKIDDGYDVVSGRRPERRDSVFRRIPSMMLNRLVRKLSGSPFRDMGCSLKVFRREMIDRLIQFEHHSRYLPVDVAWLGGKCAEVEVEHHERTKGASKYGLYKLIRTTFDLLTSISAAPLQFFGLLGLLFSMVGFGMAVRVAYVRLVMGDVNQIASVVAIFFFLTGVQLIATSVMCEYISRIYIEVQNRPYYIVKDVIE